MKTKKLTFAVVALFVTTTLFAQTEDSKFAIELNGIKNEYQGDYGSGLWNFQQENMYFGGGLNFSLYLNPSFNLGLGGSFGGYGFKKDDINRFFMRKADYDVHLDYKFNNGYLLKKTAKFYPFLTAGVGLAHYDASMHDTPYLEEVTKGIDFIVPVGAGLKYQITDGFALAYKYLYNFTNQDIRDQNRGAEKPIYQEVKGNDRFGKHVFSVIFSFGKKDSDKDGVADKYDKCPNTPAGVTVDANGCPVDGDGDGVPDYLDKCPNTPKGVKVDANGCPVDSDGDGVADYLDKCPNTPKGVTVDANGCPVDSDGDGVPDYLDKCPNTPKGVQVDANGCPVDSDGDGIPDYLDKCPDTPRNVVVDENGCPVDTDGDGIPDYLDKCPDVPGIPENKGCPEVKEETKKVFDRALQGIQFESGKDVLKSSSYKVLDEIVTILKENPEYSIDVCGHTDSSGNADKNLILSQKRADAVKKYFTDREIDEARINAVGYGINKPVADNNTAAGRAKNRRVEFKVVF